MKLVAVVRELQTDKIVDAVSIPWPVSSEENLSKKLASKWPSLKYYVQTVMTEKLESFFSKPEIEALQRIIAGEPPSSREKRFAVEIDNTETIAAVKQILIGYFKRFQGHVATVTGEAHPAIYDDEVYNVIKTVYEEVGSLLDEKKTIFVAGPVLLLPEGSSFDKRHDSFVPRLQKEPNCKMYCSVRRQPLHVRIGGSESAYFEEYHEPAAKTRVSWLFEDDTELVRSLRRMVDDLIVSGDVKRSETPDDFLFLTGSQMDKLKAAIATKIESGSIQSFGECTKDDLLRLIDQHHIV